MLGTEGERMKIMFLLTTQGFSCRVFCLHFILALLMLLALPGWEGLWRLFVLELGAAVIFEVWQVATNSFILFIIRLMCLSLHHVTKFSILPYILYVIQSGSAQTWMDRAWCLYSPLPFSLSLFIQIKEPHTICSPISCVVIMFRTYCKCVYPQQVGKYVVLCNAHNLNWL